MEYLNLERLYGGLPECGSWIAASLSPAGHCAEAQPTWQARGFALWVVDAAEKVRGWPWIAASAAPPRNDGGGPNVRHHKRCGQFAVSPKVSSMIQYYTRKPEEDEWN
jgi:hypothetical protein